MKLKHIHIDAYKVFQNFDIDFCHAGKIQELVVITGVNGNGKTTLLRDVISINGPKYMLQGNITIEDAGKTETFVFPDDLNNNSYKKAFSNVLFYKAENESSITQLQNEIIRYVDKFVYVQGKTSFEAYREIQSLIEDIFTGFNLQVRFKGITENKQLVFTNSNGNEFGIEGLSDGEQQILSKAFPLFMDNTEGRVILIDEPEGSLHPSWQTRFVSVLRRCARIKNCQFVLATHSPQLISSVHREEIRIFTRDASDYIKAETCLDGPYGWTVEKVLTEIQGVDLLRVPEVESELAILNRMLEEDEYQSDEFRKRLSFLEETIGYSDRDLVLIRMEVIRKKKRHETFNKG